MTTTTQSPLMLPKVYSSAEVAKWLGMTPDAFKQLRLRGEGPRAFKIGARKIGFLHTELVEWAERQIESAEAAPAGKSSRPAESPRPVPGHRTKSRKDS